MSQVRQYIGARYVMKVYENTLDPSSMEWEASTAYEPLTMVTFNNSSYLSKMDVPNTVGDPSTNPTYWALTGSYNGQIANLQDQIDELKGGVVTPQMYGAIGDGVTDDTTAFNDMIAAATGYIFIPEGTYLINSSLSIPSNTVIVSKGEFIDGRTVDEAAPIGLFDIDNKTNVTLDGIRIIGSGIQATYMMGAEIAARNRSKYITFRNCYVYDTPFCYGIVAYKECDHVLIDGCKINKFSYGGICNTDGCDNFTVVNCEVYTDIAATTTDNLYPISLGLYDTEYYTPFHIAKNCSAINNFVKTDVAIWEGIESHATDNLVIAGNIIENCYSGVAFVGGAVVDGVTLKVTNFAVSDNVIIGPTSGTRKAANNAGVIVSYGEDGVINGNTIKNFALLSNTSNKSPIIFSTCVNVAFRNNLVKNTGVAGETDWGVWTAYCNEIYIQNNTFTHGNHQAAFRTNLDYEVYIENNVIQDFALYISSAPTAAHDGYVRFKGNDSDVMDGNANRCVPQWAAAADIPSVQLGKVGDIIMNRVPGTGLPMGWVCTVAYVSGTPATWKALANIA